MKSVLLGSIFLLMPVSALAGNVSDIQTDVVALGSNTYHIAFQALTKANPGKLWTVLTDYDHHAGVLPYMTSSRVLQRHSQQIRVEQIGSIRILFWIFTMRVVQDVHETPPIEMAFHAVEGDFQRLEGRWHLEPLAQESNTLQMSCLFDVQPKRRVPEWAVRMAAKRYLKKMVATLVRKAEES